jgi:hypothetical protein
LEVADAIKPDDFNVLVSFARTYALAGDEKKAIEALRRADKIVTLQASWLEKTLTYRLWSTSLSFRRCCGVASRRAQTTGEKAGRGLIQSERSAVRGSTLLAWRVGR